MVVVVVIIARLAEMTLNYEPLRARIPYHSNPCVGVAHIQVSHIVVVEVVCEAVLYFVGGCLR